MADGIKRREDMSLAF